MQAAQRNKNLGASETRFVAFLRLQCGLKERRTALRPTCERSPALVAPLVALSDNVSTTPSVAARRAGPRPAVDVSRLSKFSRMGQSPDAGHRQRQPLKHQQPVLRGLGFRVV